MKTHPLNFAVGVCAQSLEVLELGHDAVEERAHAARITRRFSSELRDLSDDRVDLHEERVGGVRRREALSGRHCDKCFLGCSARGSRVRLLVRVLVR